MHFSNIFNSRFVYISPLALIAVSACRSPYQATSEVTGSIVKGPLSNALVFLDLNGNNVLDANEQSVRTDADGKFSFIQQTGVNYKIVAITDDSTIDASSGSVLAGVTLTAPKGAAVVTPTTTLMEEGGLTAEQVAAVLNLPDGVDPLTFNPFADGVDAAKALEVEKISQQIITAVNSFASAAEGAGASERGAFEAALNSVIEVVKVKAENLSDESAASADKVIDFTDATDLNLIRDKVADEAEKVVTAEGTTGFDKATLTSLVSDTAISIKNVNDQIDSVTDLTSNATKGVFSTLQVLTDQIKAAAVAEKATPGSGSIEFTDAAKVAIATANLAPTKVILTTDSVSQVGTTLLLGTLNTTDSDQPDGVAFTYSIAETDGTDHSLFSINQSTGALSLKEIPDFKSQKTYTVIIQSKDDGGKVTGKMYEIVILTDGDDDVTLTEVSELVLAMDGDDTINAGAGDDIVLGGSGNDTIDAGAGDDKIYGGAGDDTIIQSGSGTQHYDGGDGTDTYKLDTTSFGDVDLDVKVDLSTGFSGLKDNPTHALNDTLTNIENVDFSDVSWDLVLNGDENENVLKGGTGDDIIYGGIGDDILAGGGGSDVVEAGAGNDVVIHMANTVAADGGSGNDTIKVKFMHSEYAHFHHVVVSTPSGVGAVITNPSTEVTLTPTPSTMVIPKAPDEGTLMITCLQECRAAISRASGEYIYWPYAHYTNSTATLPPTYGANRNTIFISFEKDITASSIESEYDCIPPNNGSVNYLSTNTNSDQSDSTTVTLASGDGLFPDGTNDTTTCFTATEVYVGGQWELSDQWLYSSAGSMTSILGTHHELIAKIQIALQATPTRFYQGTIFEDIIYAPTYSLMLDLDGGGAEPLVPINLSFNANMDHWTGKWLQIQADVTAAG